jgi:hypothetical protein
MRRSVAGVALAALIAMPVGLAQADDQRDWGPHGPMGPNFQMGMGMGMGMGMAQGMASACSMMGQGGMRSYSGTPPMDIDHDGIVTSTEAANHFGDAFAAMDEDDDGSLTIEEFSSVYFGPGPQMAMRGDRAQVRQERKEARFKEMDADKDGAVTQEEFIAYGKKRFEASDRDKDGKVTVWEFRGRRYF